MDHLAPVMGLLGVAGIIGWIVQSILKNRRYQKVATLQADVQKRLLERFESPAELAAYLQSDAGLRFLESATFERPNVHGRIQAAVQVGIILLFAGIPFRLYLPGEAAEFLGGLAIALGAGFLVSAAITYFLAKKWGLFDGRTNLAV
jgi:hypothetical protein